MSIQASNSNTFQNSPVANKKKKRKFGKLYGNIRNNLRERLESGIEFNNYENLIERESALQLPIKHEIK